MRSEKLKYRTTRKLVSVKRLRQVKMSFTNRWGLTISLMDLRCPKTLIWESMLTLALPYLAALLSEEAPSDKMSTLLRSKCSLSQMRRPHWNWPIKTLKTFNLTLWPCSPLTERLKIFGQCQSKTKRTSKRNLSWTLIQHSMEPDQGSVSIVNFRRQHRATRVEMQAAMAALSPRRYLAWFQAISMILNKRFKILREARTNRLKTSNSRCNYNNNQHLL